MLFKFPQTIKLTPVRALPAGTRPEVRAAFEDALTIPPRENGSDFSQRLKRDVASMTGNDGFEAVDILCSTYRRNRYRNHSGMLVTGFIYTDLEGRGTAANRATYIKSLEEWARRSPSSVTARMVLGNQYILWAWDARGTGYANTVGAQAFQLMDERLRKARQTLLAATRLPEPDPYVWAELVTVGMGLNEDRKTVRGYVSQAHKIAPYTSTKASFNYLYYLAPRWHGKPGDTYRFIEEEVARTKAVMGESMYALLVDRLLNDDRKPDLKRVLQGFEDFMARNPYSDYYAKTYLQVAAGAEDKPRLKRIVQRLLDGTYKTYPSEKHKAELRAFLKQG